MTSHALVVPTNKSFELTVSEKEFFKSQPISTHALQDQDEVRNVCRQLTSIIGTKQQII